MTNKTPLHANVMTADGEVDADARATEHLRSVRTVLVRTSHPGNIGASARALRTMGLCDLHLVAPQRPLDDDSRALAAGGAGLLDAAVQVATLDEAVADCVLVLGCTARVRTVNLPQLSPRAAARALLAEVGTVALVFGNERTGLTNEELARCGAQVHIAADPSYASLNLASAVQIMAYELRRAALARAGLVEDDGIEAGDGATARGLASGTRASAHPATAAEFEGLAAHLEQTLFAIDFFKGRIPDTLMRRLRRLAQRARMSPSEVALMRGILSEVERIARLSGFVPRPIAPRRPKR